MKEENKKVGNEIALYDHSNYILKFKSGITN
jgi:hypothetical protein